MVYFPVSTLISLVAIVIIANLRKTSPWTAIWMLLSIEVSALTAGIVSLSRGTWDDQSNAFDVAMACLMVIPVAVALCVKRQATTVGPRER